MSISTNDEQAAVGGAVAQLLEEVAQHGPRGADLLYRHMADLGLSVADVERVDPGVMQDLQRTCTRCDVRKRCEDDFSAGADLDAWNAYCPNTISLESLRRLKGRFLI